jgi:stage II sporulation protein D
MMRRSIFALILVLLICPPALSGDGSENIKVLIMDSNFTSQPLEEERLDLLDSTSGDLVLESTTYRGDIEVWRSADGLYLVNELPIEDYIGGVVNAETGDNWAIEALKAQAVVVRTYLYFQILNHNKNNYNITSSVLHQLYKGLNSDSLVSKAVRATEGEIIIYEGKPIPSFYHSTCGGTTEVPEAVFGKGYPYLKSVTTSCTLSPLSIWARRIPLEDLEKATGTKGIIGIKVASRTPTGRVGSLEIQANPESVTVEAKELRRMLGWSRLPSTDFNFYLAKDTMIMEGKGYGHGVGLCQWSALEMALEGKGYREILSFFYPGTRIERYELNRL